MIAGLVKHSSYKQLESGDLEKMLSTSQQWCGWAKADPGRADQLIRRLSRKLSNLQVLEMLSSWQRSGCRDPYGELAQKMREFSLGMPGTREIEVTRPYAFSSMVANGVHPALLVNVRRSLSSGYYKVLEDCARISADYLHESFSVGIKSGSPLLRLDDASGVAVCVDPSRQGKSAVPDLAGMLASVEMAKRQREARRRTI